MNESTPRSEFVTVLAWIFIVLASFSTVVLFFQNVFFRMMFSGDMAQPMAQGMGDVPPLARLLFGHMNGLLAGLFLVSLLVLITSILSGSSGS